LPVGVDASGIAQGLVPMATGDDSWEWAEVITEKPDWTADEIDAAGILNKPTLGTAAAEDVEAFYAASTLVSEMEGIHFVTEVPTVGIDGHLYFVLEE